MRSAAQPKADDGGGAARSAHFLGARRGNKGAGADLHGAIHEFGRLIEQVTRLLRRAFDAKARAIGVTRVQWQTLMALSRDETMGQAQLAEMFEVEPITVSRLINRLQASGLVLRRDHPTDRRAHNLVLTAKARQLLTQLTPLAEECLEDALAGLEPADVDRLTGALDFVRGNLQAARQRLD